MLFGPCGTIINYITSYFVNSVVGLLLFVALWPYRYGRPGPVPLRTERGRGKKSFFILLPFVIFRTGLRAGKKKSKFHFLFAPSRLPAIPRSVHALT